MSKQILIVALWGYAGWYLGAMIAFQLGLPALVGPLLGVVGAAFIGRSYTWSTPGKVRKAVASPEATVAASGPASTTAR